MRRRKLRVSVSSLLVPLLVLGIYGALALTVDRSFVNVFPDGDQALVADMSRWFSTFTVREPFFFGQNYLFPVGSYLSVPLVWLNADPFVANEVVTALCLFGPFFVIGTILYRRRSFLLATLGYLLPIVLPSTLLIMGLAPRGLIEPIGIAAALIGVVGFGLVRRRWVLIAVFALIGLCFGAVPTGIVLFPLAGGALLLNTPTLRKAVLPAIGLAAGFAFVEAFGLFYKLHPGLIIFPRDQSFSLSWGQFALNVSNTVINQAANRSLFVLVFPALVLAVLALLGVVRLRFTMRRERTIVVASGSASVLVVIVVFASTKLADSMDSIFFTPDRLLVGLVFFPVCYLFWFERSNGSRSAPLHKPLLAAVVVLFVAFGAYSGYRVVSIAQTADARVAAFRPVPVIEKSLLEQTCKRLEAIQSPGHYLFLVGKRSDMLSYGCHALTGLKIAQENVDRRAWVVGLWNRQGLKPQKIDAVDLRLLGYRDIPFGPPH